VLFVNSKSGAAQGDAVLRAVCAYLNKYNKENTRLQLAFLFVLNHLFVKDGKYGIWLMAGLCKVWSCFAMLLVAWWRVEATEPLDGYRFHIETVIE
jgi:hypothetical protein